MALGRIKRSKAKRERARESYHRGPTIVTMVERDGGGDYWASACLGSRRLVSGRGSTPAQIKAGVCAMSFGRTPQAAIAKAVKKISGRIARRGRR